MSSWLSLYEVNDHWNATHSGKSMHSRPSSQSPINTSEKKLATCLGENKLTPCFIPNLFFWGDFKPHAKFLNPTITPSGRKVTTSERDKRRKFPLTMMGVLAHRLRTLDRSLVPPSAWAEIFRRTCLQSHLQTSPPTPQKSYLKFRNPRTKT